jgi:hypothetical protein
LQQHRLAGFSKLVGKTAEVLYSRQDMLYATYYSTKVDNPGAKVLLLLLLLLLLPLLLPLLLRLLLLLLLPCLPVLSLGPDQQQLMTAYTYSADDAAARHSFLAARPPTSSSD